MLGFEILPYSIKCRTKYHNNKCSKHKLATK